MAEPLQPPNPLPDEHMERDPVIGQQYVDQAGVNSMVRLNVIDAHVEDGRNLRRELVEAISLQPDGALLDIGCCDGSLIFDFLRHADTQDKAFHGRAVGIDIDHLSVQRGEWQAKKYYGEADLDFRLADMADMPFDDDSFDTVICSFSLHHALELHRVLAEIKRVGKPGAQILVSANSQNQKQFHRLVLDVIRKKEGVEAPPRFADRLSAETVYEKLSAFFLYAGTNWQNTYMRFNNTASDLEDLRLSLGTYRSAFKPAIAVESWKLILPGIIYSLTRTAFLEQGFLRDNINRNVTEWVNP